jgi:hypothetical protein
LCYQYDTYKLIHTYAWSRGGSKHNKTWKMVTSGY